MDRTVNIHDAKTHFSQLLKRVMSGEKIIIARAGKPVAVLSPISDLPADRIPGEDMGKIAISADFDAPLPELEL